MEGKEPASESAEAKQKTDAPSMEGKEPASESAEAKQKTDAPSMLPPSMQMSLSLRATCGSSRRASARLVRGPRHTRVI